MNAYQNVSWQQALEKLQAGKNRFTRNYLEMPDVGLARRSEWMHGQHPFAVVLACSDSRVPPNLVLNQGLEDLFVVRIAGNIATTGTVASIEYAVSALGVNLVVVLGHQQCGAVSAAMQGGDYGENLNYLFRFIQPVLQPHMPISVNEASMLNASHSAMDIPRRSPSIEHRLQAGTLKIVPAFYELDSGKVIWL